MSTKEYPLDTRQALHLLTGENPPVLIDRVERTISVVRGCFYCCDTCNSLEHIVNILNTTSWRICEPPAPPKLEPVELCSELFDIVDDFHAAPSFYRKIYGLLIAQAVRMAREEREAEKSK